MGPKPVAGKGKTDGIGPVAHVRGPVQAGVDLGIVVPALDGIEAGAGEQRVFGTADEGHIAVGDKSIPGDR